MIDVGMIEMMTGGVENEEAARTMMVVGMDGTGGRCRRRQRR